MTVNTGPKISSRATRALLSSPAITVGSMKKPLSRSAGLPPPQANRPPEEIARSR